MPKIVLVLFSFQPLVQVVPETPLERAQKLVEKVLKDANSCRTLGCTIQAQHYVRTVPNDHLQPERAFPNLRDFAFKLKPLSMSSDLIQQLKACSVKLGVCAEVLQEKIRKGSNKNKHYVSVIAEAILF